MAPRHSRFALLVAFAVAALLTLSITPALAASDSDGDSLKDAFEINTGLNPNHRDTDHNGVRDPAEDPDGDGLSNRGEQRFHTDPLDSDSDGDGTPDGQDDANGNGKPDGKEQDRRPVPANLVPSLGQAYSDVPPSYSNGCHTGPREFAIHPCVYGDTSGNRTIAIFGDSHALQWSPALTAAAKAHHWRIVSITKSACPSVDVQFQEPAFPGAEASCNSWRASGEAWLRNHPPDVVIVSNSRGYRLIDGNGTRLRGKDADKRWKQGLKVTLGDLPNSSAQVVLGDTPHNEQNIPKCLKHSGVLISDCQSSRKRAWRKGHDQAEAAGAERMGATFKSLNGLICSYDPCPIIVNRLLMWRDGSHLTETYAKELAPAITRLVRDALGQ